VPRPPSSILSTAKGEAVLKLFIEGGKARLEERKRRKRQKIFQ
jgi:hypothetical protein